MSRLSLLRPKPILLVRTPELSLHSVTSKVAVPCSSIICYAGINCSPPVMSLLPGGALNTLRDLQMRSRIQRKSAGPSSNNKLSTHKPCPHYFCPNVSKFVSSLICPPASQNVPFDSLLSCNYEELPVRTFTLSCLEGFMWKGPAYVPCYQACVKVTSCSKTGSVGIHRDGFRHHQHWPSP